ncbi:DEAD-box ATP-dependent RNA helicase CshA [Phycisphaerae bacterium RAS1]|nr:DEAD-box ATP-dependent RNA helicase CshA [Phycisphaerae bacterium RAS1]
MKQVRTPTQPKKKTPDRPASNPRPPRASKVTPAPPPQVPSAPPSPAPAPAGPGFAELGLSPALLGVLKRMGFLKPTDIQRELIPHALKRRDCLGQAKTGTGKTAAFALPMIELLQEAAGLQALVLVPTRELAAQVDENVQKFAADHPLRTALILGGKGMKQQISALRRGVEIVIGTPGRVLDLMGRKELDLSKIRLAVLDEVDRMLDIGFRDDIRRILRTIKHAHQTIFVSATLDDEIRTLARTFMHEPVEVNVSSDKLTVESVVQTYAPVEQNQKFDALVGFLKHENPTLAIVFTRTKHTARRVADRLRRLHFKCMEIHGDLMQSKREKVLASFRKQHINVLVATDLASRGLDVMEISHILNYDIPEDTASYVHRVGRTARMGNVGYAVTFVTSEQGELLTDVEKLINKELPRMDAPWVPAGPPVLKPPPLSQDAEGNERSGGPARLTEAAHRCNVLDSLGIKPVARTLGSRFRTARKFRR